jgi:hypothetical protein
MKPSPSWERLDDGLKICSDRSNIPFSSWPHDWKMRVSAILSHTVCFELLIIGLKPNTDNNFIAGHQRNSNCIAFIN